MRHKTYRRVLTTLVSVLILTCISATVAYAGVDPNADTTNGAEETTPPAVTEPEPTPTPVDPVGLTPDGQLTLVDDISGDAAADKQFLTIITKNGNYFYIVIDRAGETENVHFLNLVDESDLLALIEEETTTAATTLEPEPTPVVQEPEPEPEPEPKSNLSAILGIILLLALAGGGAFFYIKVLKPGRAGRSAAVPSDAGEFNLDDDFFDEDDELDELPAGDIDITAPDGQTEPYSYEDYEEKGDER